MAYPNTLIFVDFPADDTKAAANFYAKVFRWKVEGRPTGWFHRIVPGMHFLNPDGSASEIGNLHMGIYETSVAVPDPNPKPSAGTQRARGAGPRVYILVSDDDTQDRILDTAAQLGATVLWRDHYWKEFNGFHGAFRDPWGTEVILWSKPGDDPRAHPTYDASRVSDDKVRAAQKAKRSGAAPAATKQPARRGAAPKAAPTRRSARRGSP
jgi:predicted enzyme related to lactoylglutathione lyase